MQKELSKEAAYTLLSRFEPKREYILSALHTLQDAHQQQYISAGILDAVSEYFKLTKAELFGIVTYYSMFSLKPRGKYHFKLCHSPVCRIMDTDDILNVLKEKISSHNQGLFSIETVACLGRCGKAPSMMVNHDVYTGLENKKLDEIIEYYKNKDDNDAQ